LITATQCSTWKVNRLPTEEEREQEPELAQISKFVCNDHLQEALDEFPEVTTKTKLEDSRPSMSVFASELSAWLEEPEKKVVPANEIDLSGLAEEIGSINQGYDSREKQIREEEVFVASNQDRITQQLVPLTEEFGQALSNAHFRNIRVVRDGITSLVAGHILATAWRGEVELYYEVRINVEPAGTAHLRTLYFVRLSGEDKNNDLIFWQSESDFLVGGENEIAQMKFAISESKKHFRPCVEYVLSLSKGGPPKDYVP
jgi:hypothetical protein